METPEESPPQRTLRFRWPAIVIGSALVVGLLALLAVSPVPMRGAEVFGVVVNKIKGHPGATAFWTFTGLGLLWTAIGMLTAVQEWLATRRKAR